MMEQVPSMLTWKFMTRILQHVREGIILLNPEGEVTLMNRAARKLLRVDPQTTIQQVTDLPAEVQHLWRNRHSKRDFSAYQVHINVIAGFGDGLAILLSPTVERESSPPHSLDHELQTILNASPDEIFITDGKGKVLRVSDHCEALYGRTKEDLIGRQVTDLEKEGIFSPSSAALAIARNENVSLVQETSNERILWVQAQIIRDEREEIERVICYAKDITDLAGLRSRLQQEEHPSLEIQQHTGPLIFRSPAMTKQIRFAKRVAQMDSTVLLLGETGVGKGEVARFIHRNSRRNEKPFVVINCGAIPEALMESELFGYEGGAFTGANKHGKVGLLEQAEGGTLFLDEIAELPLALQVKLLHVLQDGIYSKVGGYVTKHSDIRVIAATNQNLEELVQSGRFRQDLYYRLHVIPLMVPPLRERPEDVIPLLLTALERLIEKNGQTKQFSMELLSVLAKYSWPGNVRELQNMVEWLYIVSEGEWMELDSLPPSILRKINLEEEEQEPIVVNKIIPLKEAIDWVERELIRKAQLISSSTYQIAELLKVNQSTIVRKMNKTSTSTDELLS